MDESIYDLAAKLYDEQGIDLVFESGTYQWTVYSTGSNKMRKIGNFSYEQIILLIKGLRDNERCNAELVDIVADIFVNHPMWIANFGPHATMHEKECYYCALMKKLDE